MVPIGLAGDVSLEFCSSVVIHRPAHVVRRTLHETRLFDADGVSCIVAGVQLTSSTERVRQMSNSSAPGTRQPVYATLVQARTVPPDLKNLLVGDSWYMHGMERIVHVRCELLPLMLLPSASFPRSNPQNSKTMTGARSNRKLRRPVLRNATPASQ